MDLENDIWRNFVVVRVGIRVFFGIGEKVFLDYGGIMKKMFVVLRRGDFSVDFW